MANDLETTAWRLTPPGVSARTGAAAHILLIAFLLLTFIGTHPLADISASARTDGDIVDRVASLSLLALAGALMWRRRAEAAALAAHNLGFFAVLAICAVSILWSAHPELTLRRSALLCILAVIAFAAVLTMDDLRRMHTRLFIVMTAIILLNILATLAFPGRAITALGVQGLYTQKNVAGTVAMIAAIVAATWILGASDWRSRGWGCLALVTILGFLIVTRSKTSMNITALGLAATMVAGLVERFRTPLVLLTIIAGSVILAVGLIWLAVFDFDFSAATSAILGDSSFTGRDEIWAFTLRDAGHRLWLGAGYGAYWDVGQRADPLLRAEAGSWLASVETGIINQAHHGYIELWLHVGLPATILAALVVATRAGRGGLATLFAPRSREWRAFVLCMTLTLALNLLHNLTEATLFMRGAPMWNFAMLAYFALSAAFHGPGGVRDD